jgi:hypothetical protein
MKYAGVAEGRLWTEQAGRPPAELVEFLATRMRPAERVIVLMTYTALLQFRQALSDSGAVSAFWEQ